MALYASWSPGIAFMPAEFPADTVQVNNVAGSQIVGLRQSGGATFQGIVGSSNWFHVPIATPVIVAGVRLSSFEFSSCFNLASSLNRLASALPPVLAAT